jgi:hypothetical protein
MFGRRREVKVEHERKRRRFRVWPLLVIAALVGGMFVACGDDDDGDGETDIDEIDDQAAEVTDSAGARGVAEALRLVLIEDDLDDDQHVRDVDVLQESVDDLPGEPEVLGIADEDGDGKDDDGKVEIRVNDEVACMSVSMDSDVEVTGGGC